MERATEQDEGRERPEKHEPIERSSSAQVTNKEQTAHQQQKRHRIRVEQEVLVEHGHGKYDEQGCSHESKSDRHAKFPHQQEHGHRQRGTHGHKEDVEPGSVAAW